MKQFNTIIEYASNWDIGTFVIIAIITFLANHKKIIQLFIQLFGCKKKSKLRSLNKALKCQYVTGVTKKHLEEEMAMEHFRINTGLKLEKKMREAIIKTHQNTHGEVPFSDFRHASSFLVLKKDKLSVNINKFDKIYSWYHLLFGATMAISSLISAIITFVMFFNRFPEHSEHLIKPAVFFFASLMFLLLGLLITKQSEPYFSAQKIKKHLKHH